MEQNSRPYHVRLAPTGCECSAGKPAVSPHPFPLTPKPATASNPAAEMRTPMPGKITTAFIGVLGLLACGVFLWMEFHSPFRDIGAAVEVAFVSAAFAAIASVSFVILICAPRNRSRLVLVVGLLLLAVDLGVLLYALDLGGEAAPAMTKD